MSEQDISDQIGGLTGTIRDLVHRIDEGALKAKAGDGGREAAARDGIAESAGELTKITEAQRKAEIEEAVKAALASQRSPSAAGILGTAKAGSLQEGPRNRMRPGAWGDVSAHPALKALIPDYQGGELFTAVDAVRSLGGGFDQERVAWGKAKLQDLGVMDFREGVPDRSVAYYTIEDGGKATLGTTGATGGYVLPNNLVDDVVKPGVQAAVYTAGPNPLVTVIPGVAVRGVDMPFRTGAPSRLLPQDWGAVKENVNEAYGTYTATLATFARIYDVSKQYLRFSAGSAERDIVDELTKAQWLAENYAVIAGPGTGTVGTGDPTLGVYTALNAQFGAFTTAHTGSSSTIAGSRGGGVHQGVHGPVHPAADPDRHRHRRHDLLDGLLTGVGHGRLLDVGVPGRASTSDRTTRSDGAARRSTTTPTSAPTRPPRSPSRANGRRAKFYRGMEFRVDSTDVAGERWDRNLVGFRGELEFGFNAMPAVITGAFQLVTGVIP